MSRRVRQIGCLLLALFALVVGRTAEAAFVVNVNFSGDAQYQPAFANAKSVWESYFSGYQNGIVANSFNSGIAIGQPVMSLLIDAEIRSIDGVGGQLGQAGFTRIAIDQAGFRLATEGQMVFDSADVQNNLNNGTFNDIVLHEMAHVMGFGTLWALNNVYNAGSGEFTGTKATSVWQTEFGQTGTPDVELGGGSGTEDAHWNEIDFGAGLTGIRDSQSRDMRDELMTGWLNPNPFISELTLASFVDIGFARVSAVPEPGSLSLLAISGCATWLIRRKRCVLSKK